jgi:hypothetical protein
MIPLLIRQSGGALRCFGPGPSTWKLLTAMPAPNDQLAGIAQESVSFGRRESRPRSAINSPWRRVSVL